MGTHLQTPLYGDDRLVDLLTINDVARVLRITRASVYGLIRKGELVPIRVGQRARFEPADIRAYLDRHREDST
jgi:excisionase family DNA binding protein